MNRRARKPKGSVVFNRLRATWNFLWCEGNQRRSYRLGTLAELPTKADAEKKAETVRRDFRLQRERAVVTVKELVEQYRIEKMPQRASTRRGYEIYLRLYILPKWQDSSITELQARAVELWLKSLDLAPKSKVHVRGLLSVLWDYAMWRGDVPTQRNPMELVQVRNASKRTRKPRTMTIEQFHKLSGILTEPYRTMATVGVCLGLRWSELVGLQWQDIDWLNGELKLQRAVVKQIEDEVKTVHSSVTLPRRAIGSSPHR